MNATALAAIVTGVTALVGGTGVIVLQARAERVLRDRVLAASGRAMVTDSRPARREQSIRSRTSDENPRLAQLFRIIGHRPEMGTAGSLPWPVIVAIGAAAGVFAVWRARHMLGDLVGIPIGCAAGIFAMRTLFKRGRTKYSNKLFKQIPDAISLMIRAIRAGIPLAEALRSVAREMPEPTRGEFGRVVGAVSIGRPVDQAIWTLYARTGLTEYSYLAVTVGLQTQTGGSLAETLENLADMVRKRVAMAGKARALASEARVSATVMIALPFLAALVLSFIVPGYLDTFINTPTGNNLAMTGLSMVGAGGLTMRWLTLRALSD